MTERTSLPPADRPLQLAFRTRVSISAALIASNASGDSGTTFGDVARESVKLAITIENEIDKAIREHRGDRG
jgi:hypothetical protein